MTIVELCNRALDIIGQGAMIESLDEVSPEAEMCKRHFMPTYLMALDMFNWSFARRDEIIDEENLLSDVTVLPYLHAYELPEDVMRILYLTELDAPSRIESVGFRDGIPFNFRNYDGKKVLATDHRPGFVVHYQATIEDINLCPPLFLGALTNLLAAELAASSIGSNDRVNISNKMRQVALALMTQAAANDAQQGAYVVDNNKHSRFIDVRTSRGRRKWR